MATAAATAEPTFVRRLPLTAAALAFARERHAGQRRLSDAAPFVLHPLEVASMLHLVAQPDHVVAAGVLHDVLEDTDADVKELEWTFGDRVAGLVAAVTEDPTIEPEDQRKAALRRQVAAASPEAALIFAADKVAKARELRMRSSREVADPGSRPDVEHARSIYRHYRASLEVLEAVLSGHPLVEQLRFELEALDAFPPAGTETAAAEG